MTNKEKFLAGYRFGFGNGEALMIYKAPIGDHPFGRIETAGCRCKLGICETPGITESRFFIWTFWMNERISKEVFFKDLMFFEP